MSINSGFLTPNPVPPDSEEMPIVNHAPLTHTLLIITVVIVADFWGSPMMPDTSHLIIMPIPRFRLYN